jgi:serine/threonine protein kinase
MDGIPTAYDLFDYQGSRVLVMDHMGPSLESLFCRNAKRFSLKTVLMIVDQILRIIEWIHKCGVVHRDIKPQNFLVGRGELRNKIFLIDFGISTAYRDLKTHRHCPYSRDGGLAGTVYYASVNVHLGDQQSRRDDLESVLYVVIRFLLGGLPWDHTEAATIEERNDKIGEMKARILPDVLCAGLPVEFAQTLAITRSLSFDDRPDYFAIRTLFRRCFVREGFVYDNIFDWDERAANHDPEPKVYLSQSAAMYQQINERQVRSKREKIAIPRPGRIFFGSGISWD